MVANTKVNGSKTTCRVRAFTFGMMDEYIKENIRTTRSKVMAFIHGLMNVSIAAIGTWENSTASALTLSKRKTNSSMVFGRMGDEKNGLMRNRFGQSTDTRWIIQRFSRRLTQQIMSFL